MVTPLISPLMVRQKWAALDDAAGPTRRPLLLAARAATHSHPTRYPFLRVRT